MQLNIIHKIHDLTNHKLLDIGQNPEIAERSVVRSATIALFSLLQSARTLLKRKTTYSLVNKN